MPSDFAQKGDIFIFLDGGPPLLFLGIKDQYPRLVDRYRVEYWNLRTQERIDISFKNSEFSIHCETKLIRNGEEIDLSGFFNE